MINRRMILLSEAAAVAFVERPDVTYVPFTAPKLEPAPLLERSKDEWPTTRDRIIEFNGLRMYSG